MEHLLQNVGVVVVIVMAFLGWAYTLGRADARITRNEKDIAEELRQRNVNSADLRQEIRENFAKINDKIDSLACKNPSWRKDDCR